MPALLVCPRCQSALSRPIEPVPDARLVDADGLGTMVPEGSYLEAASSRWAAATRRRYVWIHPHDLMATQVVPGGFGCCGYAPFSGDNLHCRCGEPVGFFVDECSFRFEVALAGAWRDAAAPAIPPGLPARLDACARHHRYFLKESSGAVSEGSCWRWDPGRGPRIEPDELALRVAARGGVEVVWGGGALFLPMSPLVLTRAIATVRLPIGDGTLAVCYQFKEHPTELSASLEWGLVRRGDLVEIVAEGGGAAQVLAVWDEWLAFAWSEAVAAWLAQDPAI